MIKLYHFRLKVQSFHRRLENQQLSLIQKGVIL